MPVPPQATKGALLAFAAAVSWGGGDFAGGMGSKATGGTVRGALRLLLSAHGLSLLALLLVLVFQHATLPHGRPVIWGLACGVIAGSSLAAFYIALAQGAMGESAAISGLLAAAIPAAVGIALEGRPTLLRGLGFLLAAVAIPLVASSADGSSASRSTTVLAIAGGVGFGLYFAGMKFAGSLGVLEPLALARTGSITTCALALIILHWKGGVADPAPWLNVTGWFWAAGIASLDSGGNLLYIAATRAARLDVAAVLASLYPASTILLAAAVLKERPGRLQLTGMALAMAAVVLVTL